MSQKGSFLTGLIRAARARWGSPGWEYTKQEGVAGRDVLQDFLFNTTSRFALTAEQGSFALNGQNATLTWPNAPTAATLLTLAKTPVAYWDAGDPANYVLSGSNCTTLYDLVGSLDLTGYGGGPVYSATGLDGGPCFTTATGYQYFGYNGTPTGLPTGTQPSTFVAYVAGGDTPDYTIMCGYHDRQLGSLSGGPAIIKSSADRDVATNWGSTGHLLVWTLGTGSTPGYEFWINGELQNGGWQNAYNTTPSNGGNDRLLFGTNADGLTGQKVAVFAIYDKALSTRERQEAEGVIMHARGQQSRLPSSHPYRTTAPGTGITYGTTWTPYDLSDSKKVGWFRADDSIDFQFHSTVVVRNWSNRFGNDRQSPLYNEFDWVSPWHSTTSFNSSYAGVAFTGGFLGSTVYGLSDEITAFYLLDYQGGNTNDGRLLSMRQSSTANGGGSDANAFGAILAIDSSGNVFWYADGTGYGWPTAIGTNPASLTAQFKSGANALRKNGASVDTDTDTFSFATTDQIKVGASWANDSEIANAIIAEIIYVKGATTADIEKIEGYAHHRRSLQTTLDSGHTYYSTAPANATAYSLTAAQGSFALNGQDATLTPVIAGGGTAYSLTADQASFALTGQSSAQQISGAAGQGSYALTGQASLQKISGAAGQGSYALTGQAALQKISGAAAQGSYALTGQSAAQNISGAAGQGSYALTGQSAAQQISGASEQGSFTLNGQNATLTYSGSSTVNYSITADQGSYSLTGQSSAQKLSGFASQGSYTLTGQSAAQKHSMAALQGSYTLSGQAAAQAISGATAQGSYALSGQAALKKISVAAGQGSFALSGQDANLVAVVRQTYSLSADRGLYTLTGVDVALSYGAPDRPRGVFAGSEPPDVVHFTHMVLSYQWEADGIAIPGATNKYFDRSAYGSDVQITCNVTYRNRTDAVTVETEPV